jgi:hypothetical protein
MSDRVLRSHSRAASSNPTPEPAANPASLVIQTPTPPPSTLAQQLPFFPPLPTVLSLTNLPKLPEDNSTWLATPMSASLSHPATPPAFATPIAPVEPTNLTSGFHMSVSDIDKTFANISRLTSQKDWPMWAHHVTQAAKVIRNLYFANTGSESPQSINTTLLNALTGRIDNNILVHYLNVNEPEERLTKLKDRFNPKTSVTDANEVYQLFQLRCPIYDLDKLIDGATDLFAHICMKELDISQYVFSAAVMGIIPPAYQHVCQTYESAVRHNTAPGDKPDYHPKTLIQELCREFQNYCATHTRKPGDFPKAKTTGSSTSTTTITTHIDKGKGVEHQPKSNVARTAATPYTKLSASTSCPLLKCFNCNENSHTTPICPKPWTPKSTEAMKKKGITCSKVAQYANVAAGPSTQPASIKEVSSQSDWVNPLSSGDVMNIDDNISHTIAFPLFTALSDQERMHILDSGATIHCTPYCDLLFNAHTTPLLNLTVANSEQLDLRLAGDMQLELSKNGSKPTPFTHKNVYYNAKLPFTLISIAQLPDASFTFKYACCTISDLLGNVLGTVHKSAKLYAIVTSKFNEEMATLSILELYKQLGHMSYTNIKQLLKLSPSVITTTIDDFSESPCEDCILNNIHHTSVPKKQMSPLATFFGEHFHIDIFGPLCVQAIAIGALYWLTIVDDSTRWLTLAPLKTKDDAYVSWVTFLTELFTQYGIKVKLL